MPYCYKCGKEINKTASFCPKCGASMSIVKTSKKKDNSALSGLFILLALVGAVIGLFLLIGGAIATLMNPTIENTSAEGRVWIIGYLIWLIFYSTGLIDSCFLIGIISLGISTGLFFISEKID